jgi:hypothetical protein
VIVIGVALASALARGRTPSATTLRVIFAVTLITTLAIVFSLFIHRPGGNSATVLAYGGYPALVGVNLVKTSAVVTLVMFHRKKKA